ncbi:hypothetical protein LJR290_006826 [Variovorax sp. LjRoot290]|uniref:hypothetical protein n=1 Tax=Variovorax sp. LjRoot290 TaxID=3342316 RepID=UPI003ECFE18F
MISARKLVSSVVAALLASGAAALAYRAASEPRAAPPMLRARSDPLVSVTPAQRTDLPIRIAAEGHVTPLAPIAGRP